ncbi:Z-ring associated protein ZapG [Photobacterium sp. CCB-ST2H9]|uniref:Z-ring associated protein ZapG n=1 Tax=unclassified Photobacterium TaxID=2628852 RepID=UPI0020064108|nr:Z-ring associated protein ZapG [Photobacterium sp. CCB-ST2H9]UTM57677.1 Z-ring associated protein ZapG [Photobacterium sp. CCB-ST2H9]
MAWIYAILIFVAGALVGAFAARLGNKNLKQQKELQKELDKTKYQLEQYRQELIDHFARSSDLLDNLAKDYSKLYEHMAKTSAELMPNLPEQDNPFSQRISTLTAVAEASEPVSQEEQESTQQPRDYANGASGLLKAEERALEEPAKAS